MNPRNNYGNANSDQNNPTAFPSSLGGNGELDPVLSDPLQAQQYPNNPNDPPALVSSHHSKPTCDTPDGFVRANDKVTDNCENKVYLNAWRVVRVSRERRFYIVLE